MQNCDILEQHIPEGPYCYSRQNGHIRVCPFWRTLSEQYPDQEAGYCTYLKIGDFMENSSSILWDHIKECDVNFPDEVNDNLYVY